MDEGHVNHHEEGLEALALSGLPRTQATYGRHREPIAKTNDA